MIGEINKGESCTLILPHFDDEYVGCRSIIESDYWNVKKIVWVTNSAIQLALNRESTSVWYERRSGESSYYIYRETPDPVDKYYHIDVELWDFPELLWDQFQLEDQLVKKLILCWQERPLVQNTKKLKNSG